MEDVLSDVFNIIDKVSACKTLSITCTKWKIISKQIINICNPTLYIINRFPNKNWIWYTISKNPNIGLDYIFAHLDKDWHWEAVSVILI